jgi:hypothetical protein
VGPAVQPGDRGGAHGGGGAGLRLAAALGAGQRGALRHHPAHPARHQHRVHQPLLADPALREGVHGDQDGGEDPGRPRRGRRDDQPHRRVHLQGGDRPRQGGGDALPQDARAVLPEPLRAPPGEPGGGAHLALQPLVDGVRASPAACGRSARAPARATRRSRGTRRPAPPAGAEARSPRRRGSGIRWSGAWAAGAWGRKSRNGEKGARTGRPRAVRPSGVTRSWAPRAPSGARGRSGSPPAPRRRRARRPRWSSARPGGGRCGPPAWWRG